MLELLKIDQVKYTLNEIQNNQCSNDRKYTIDPLIQVLKDLLNNNIHDVPDFTTLFKKHGLKTKEIINCINQFVKNYNLNHQKEQISWFKSRSWRQLKYYHKNFVITKLALDYEIFFIDHFKKYATNNLTSKENIEMFIKDIKFKMEKVKNQSLGGFKKIQINNESIKYNISNILNNDDGNFEYASYENNNDIEFPYDNQTIFY